MSRYFSLLLLIVLTGCTLSKEQYTAGHVGCPADEVTVVSETGGFMANSWVATCRGKTFHCVYMTGGRIACSPEVPKQD